MLSSPIHRPLSSTFSSLGPPFYTHTHTLPKCPNIPVPRHWGCGSDPVAEWPKPRCASPSFQAGGRGADPPGRAGLRVHSSCPGRRGAGEGSAKKRNRPGLSVGDTKRRTQRGPRGAKGAAPGTVHPHTCAGAGGRMRTAHSSAGAGGGASHRPAA